MLWSENWCNMPCHAYIIEIKTKKAIEWRKRFLSQIVKNIRTVCDCTKLEKFFVLIFFTSDQWEIRVFLVLHTCQNQDFQKVLHLKLIKSVKRAEQNKFLINSKFIFSLQFFFFFSFLFTFSLNHSFNIHLLIFFANFNQKFLKRINFLLLFTLFCEFKLKPIKEPDLKSKPNNV